MPAALALPAFWGAVSAGVAGTAGIVAGKMGANASREAANATVTATNHAADLQSKSNAEALAFEKQKDAEAQANAARTEQANYNQWAAREGRLSDFGQALGLSARNIPAYQPMTGAAGSATSGDPKVASFIADYQKTHPVSEGIAPIADALKKAGLSSGRFDYGGGNLSNNEVTVGGKPYKVLGGEGTPAAYWYVPGMNDGAPKLAPYAANFASVIGAPRVGGVLTPALQMPNSFAGAF